MFKWLDAGKKIEMIVREKKPLLKIVIDNDIANVMVVLNNIFNIA